MTLQDQEIYTFIGSYTKRDAVGIRVFAFHTETGSMRLLHEINESNATFLDVDMSSRRLYCTAEMPDGKSGAVAVYSIDPKSGQLEFVNRQPAEGGRPTYVRLDQDRRLLLAANYGSSNVNVYPLGENGRLEPMSDVHHLTGSGPNRERQEKAHPHCIMPDEHNRFVFVPDLGADAIIVYRLDLTQHKLLPHDTVNTPAGSGPRHIVFHPNGRFAYVVHELDATVNVLRYDADSGSLESVQITPGLPADFNGENTAAEIRISPDGRYLYTSNRGHDSIATFAVNPDHGTLTPVGHVSSGGSNPRHFNLSPDGRFLVCAHQDSDNVVVFRIDTDSGLPVPTGIEVQAAEGVCVQFASM